MINQPILAATCRIIIGPTGRRIAAFSDVTTAFTQGIFKDYYRLNHAVCRQSFYKYLKTTQPYPHFLAQHYGPPNGRRRTLSDMMGIVDACTSIMQVRQIQYEVHQWSVTNLSAEEAAALNQNYVAQNASRREVAVYLTDVLQHALGVDETGGENR